MEVHIGVGVFAPKVFKQVVVVKLIADRIANRVGTFAALLLAFGPSIAAPFGQTCAVVATILDPRCLSVATVRHAILPIVGSKVAVLATAVTQVRPRVGAILNPIGAVVGNLAV
jgi:hypothetical protein